jgi:hypothetical protein
MMMQGNPASSLKQDLATAMICLSISPSNSPQHQEASSSANNLIESTDERVN